MTIFIAFFFIHLSYGSGECRDEDNLVYNGTDSQYCGGPFGGTLSRRISSCVVLVDPTCVPIVLDYFYCCNPKPCTELISKGDKYYPCYVSDCYYDAVGSQCVTTCDNKHYTEKLDTLWCVLKTCTARLYNATATFPCGSSDCYYDVAAPASVGKQCVGTCTDDSHHKGTITNYACELKDCGQRLYNGSAVYPCGGNNCFAQYTGAHLITCGVSCMNSDHFAPDYATGWCVEMACSQRTANVSKTEHPEVLDPCGSGWCFADTGRDNLTCIDLQYHAEDTAANETAYLAAKCTRDGHYVENNVTHRCEMRLCNARTVDGENSNNTDEGGNNTDDGGNSTTEGGDDSHTFPCGSSDCYQQLYSGGNGTWLWTCDTVCPTNLSYGNLSTRGKCVLKDCMLRSANNSHAFPCGTSDCYLQPNGTCATDCPASHYIARAADSTCVLRNCSDRRNDPSALLPCGPNCYLQEISGELGEGSAPLCETGCKSDTFYVQSPESGRCEERDCAAFSLWVCRNASWCVVTEDTPTACGSACTDPAHYAMSDCNDPFDVRYRKCVEKESKGNESNESKESNKSKGGYTGVVIIVMSAVIALLLIVIVVIVIIWMRKRSNTKANKSVELMEMSEASNSTKDEMAWPAECRAPSSGCDGADAVDIKQRNDEGAALASESTSSAIGVPVAGTEKI